MQFGSAAKPPLGVFYDSDFGSNIDSVLALALLQGFAGKNLIRLITLSISNPDLKSAQLCDVIQKYYASATSGMAAMFLQGPPIGLINGKAGAESSLISGTLGKKDAEGKPAYEPRIHEVNDTAVPEVLIRNFLMAQHDGNAIIVSSGPATNLARLLSLRNAADLVLSKVKHLVLVGGDFPQSKPDQNFSADVDSIQKVLADWPTPVLIAGRALGTQLPYPGESIEKDFTYTPNQPIADAYRAAGKMPYDAPAPTMAAALYSAQPDNYFKLSDTGTLTVAADGSSKFQQAADGRHRFLQFDAEQKTRIIEKYREMASAKPVPRTLRRPGQPVAPPKPEQKSSATEKKS